MFIPGLIITLLIFLAGSIVYLIGLIVWIVLTLMKEMLNLKIKIGSDDDE